MRTHSAHTIRLLASIYKGTYVHILVCIQINAYNIISLSYSYRSSLRSNPQPFHLCAGNLSTVAVRVIDVHCNHLTSFAINANEYFEIVVRATCLLCLFVACVAYECRGFCFVCLFCCLMILKELM